MASIHRRRMDARALLVAAVLASTPLAARAANLLVPDQYATIQAAMNAARNGDVVSIAAGHYVERITFSGNWTFTVQGAGAETTILDGGLAGTTVTFTANSSTLRGVTVTGGRNYQYDGGGIYIDGGSPVIEDCVVEGNVAGNGAGIAIDDGTPVIRRNVIRENVEGCGSGCKGGGILVGFWVSGTPQIYENVIERNTSETGAGIAVSSGNPLIERNVIRDNFGDPINGGTQGGEGIYVGRSAKIVGNLIEGNERLGIGVGTLFSTDTVLVVNNTIVGNGMSSASALVAKVDGGKVEVVNNVLAGEGPAVNCFGSAAATAVFRSNVVFGSPGAHATGCTLSGGSSTGNVTEDPLLVDPAYGNFRLRPSSPAVDAATTTMPAGVTLPPADLDGSARAQGGAADRGAYEYRGLTSVTAPTLVDFGAQRVGTTSLPRTITFTNAGAIPLDVSEVSVTGDYAFTSDCRGPDGIAPGLSCTATVTFQPTARFARAGSLVLRGNVGQLNGAPATPSGEIAATVDLTGTGIAPHVVLSSDTLAFGAQRVGTTSAAQQLVVTNDGEVDLVVSSIAVAVPYAASPSGCTIVAAGGGTCAVDVTFSPPARGAFARTLTISSDAINAPSVVSVSGQGVAPVVSLDRSSLTFGTVRVGESDTPQTITLTNTGDAPLAIASITPVSPFSGPNDCPGTLLPAAHCAIQVGFTADTTGTLIAYLTIRHDAVGGSTTVPLSGKGVDFRVYLSDADALVYRGTTATYTVVLERIGSLPFTFPVALSCSGAPAGATCTFSPSATVTPQYQYVVTMQVPVPATAAGGAGAASLGFFLLPLPALALGLRRRRAALVAALLVALAGATACSGGGPPGGGGTEPPGNSTYTLTVTATSGPLVHTDTATLNVR
jgi:nitrous oxidase accessory protein NosD